MDFRTECPCARVAEALRFAEAPERSLLGSGLRQKPQPPRFRKAERCPRATYHRLTWVAKKKMIIIIRNRFSR